MKWLLLAVGAFFIVIPSFLYFLIQREVNRADVTIKYIRTEILENGQLSARFDLHNNGEVTLIRHAFSSINGTNSNGVRQYNSFALKPANFALKAGGSETVGITPPEAAQSWNADFSFVMAPNRPAIQRQSIVFPSRRLIVSIILTKFPLRR